MAGLAFLSSTQALILLFPLNTITGKRSLLSQVTCGLEMMAKKDTTLAIDEDGEDEKKVEEMKRRRSSIIQCELLMRDFSARSVNINSTEKIQNRRKSLIKIGKIEG